MKKIFITLFIIASFLLVFIFLADPALAAPYLVCDPQAGVQTYNVYRDGVEVGADIAAQPDGSLRYDLAAIPPGAYDWTAEACNVWGCAITPDPFVSPGAMSAPVNLHLAE